MDVCTVFGHLVTWHHLWFVQSDSRSSMSDESRFACTHFLTCWLPWHGSSEFFRESCDPTSDSLFICHHCVQDPCSSMGKVGTNNVFAMAGAPPPPMLQTMHTPSSTPVIQNRSRIVNYGPMPPPAPFGSIPPQSLGALPPQLVANARRQTSQEMDALHRKLAALYTPDQFEPTPINPNLQLRMGENTQIESAKPTLENEILQSKLPTRSIIRSDSSDSLDLKKVFTNEIEDHKKVLTNEIETQKPRDRMDELSQQLSNMSFSIGDIAAINEDGNLSGIFDESMRVRDNSTAKLKSSLNKEDDSLSVMFDESMRVRDNGNSKLKPSQPNNNKSMNMSIGLTDMSLSSFAGESQFAVDSSLRNFAMDSNVMSTTSISRVFDESVD